MSELLVILIPTLFLGSIFSTVAGSGLGIILLVVFTIFFDIHLSIVFSSLIGFIIHPAKFLHFRQHTNWRIVRWYIVLGVPLSFLGGQLLFNISTRPLEIAMSVMLMSFLLMSLSKYSITIKPTNRNVALAGAINGLQAGMLGLGNFIRNPALLAFGLRKGAFIGTASVISLCLNIGKTTAYIPNVEWSQDIIIMLAASVAPVLLGVWIGKKLHHHISDATFEKLLLLVIFGGIVRLLLFP